MDANINEQSLILIKMYRTIDKYINNQYKPYRKNTIKYCIGNDKEHKNKYYSTILDALKNNKKVISHCGSYQIVKSIYEQLYDHFKVLVLHGHNYDVHSTNKDGTCNYHKDFKNMITTNINENISNYDLVLYTSTVTNGLNIDINYFDMFIHYYDANTITSDLFIQSCFWNRKYKEQIHYLFLTNYMHKLKITPKQLFNKNNNALNNVN